MRWQASFCLALFFLNCFGVQKAANCGQKFSGVGNIFGGHRVISNAWPWLTVFLNKSKKTFFCGGSLISAKTVVSAAHCFRNKHQVKQTPIEAIAVVAGKHNLAVANELGSSVHDLKRVVIHPDWKYNDSRFDADIAFIVLATKVTLGDWITPVCLPSKNDVFVSGTAVGWGRSEHSTAKGEFMDSTPNELPVSIPTQENCFLAVPRLVFIASDRTFCAGYIDQTKSICTGDSGGGFYSHNWNTGLFTLNGIISSSLMNNQSCNTETYSLFTDVKKYVDWIKQTAIRTRTDFNFNPFSLRFCRLDDPQRDVCIKRSIQAFLPTLRDKSNKFDFPPLEPITKDDVTINYSGLGIVGVINSRNLKAFGLTLSTITNVQTSINGYNMKITIDLRTPRLDVSGEYKFDFSYSGVPFKTDGSYEHTLTDSTIQIIFNGRLETLHGEDYMKIYKCEVALNPSEIKLMVTDKFVQSWLNDWLNSNRRDFATTMILQTKHHWESLMIDVANKIFSKTPFRQILIQD